MGCTCNCSGLVSLANLLTTLATLAGIAALFSPYWVTSTNLFGSSHVGLFYACSETLVQDVSCGVFDTTSMPDWHNAVLGLWAGGCILLFIFAIASCCLCCEQFQKASCSGVVFLGTLIAVSAFIAAVVIYGVKYHSVNSNISFDRDGAYFFDWSYYLAIITAGLGIIAVVILATVICCVRRK